nr:immunoglobulin heavy chain junction region [Mus musculus]
CASPLTGDLFAYW